MNTDIYYSRKDVADMLGVNVATVTRWNNEGRLSFVKLGRKIVRISKKDLDTFLMSGGVQ